MSKKITVLLIFIVMAGCFFGGLFNKQTTKIGKLDYTNKMVVVKEDGTQSSSPINGNNGYSYSPPPAGAIPGLNNYMDYTTNGNSLQEILALGDTIIVAIAYCDSLEATNANGGITLRSRYNYSFDGGTTWIETNGIDLTNDQKSRYPDLFPDIVSGSRTVGTGGRFFDPPANGTTRRGGISRDILLGAGSPENWIFPWAGGSSVNSDAFVHRRADGKVGVVQSPNSTDSLIYTTWDPSNGTNTGRKHVYAPPSPLGNTVSSYTIGASQNANHMTIANCYINEPGNGGDNYRSQRMITSTDNGTTWSAPVKFGFDPASPNVLGGDSCQTYWHQDIAYKPGTSTPYLVFSTYPYVWANGTTQVAIEENKGWKIMIQSTAINGGAAPVTIADWHNITILSDLNQYNQIVDFQVNSALLSHPSIGFSGDGNTIWVTYSVIQKDSCVGFAGTFNYFDVYTQKSTDGGMTWSTPFNVSSTLLEDEMYPVVAETGNTSFAPFLMYNSNNPPGCHAFTDNQTVGIVYAVFKGQPIGIINISTEIPEKYTLNQNYPNPFNPTTKIRFAVPKSGNVSMYVYDITGKQVATIAKDEFVNAGLNEVQFDGANLASGVYFYTLNAGSFTETKKMILVK